MASLYGLQRMSWSWPQKLDTVIFLVLLNLERLSHLNLAPRAAFSFLVPPPLLLVLFFFFFFFFVCVCVSFFNVDEVRYNSISC